MNIWDLAWAGMCLVSICANAWENRRARRRTREALDRRAESELKRMTLQHAIDRAWDAAHEFRDEPEIALNVVCAYLEDMVTPLPPMDTEFADALEEWLREESS